MTNRTSRHDRGVPRLDQLVEKLGGIAAERGQSQVASRIALSCSALSSFRLRRGLVPSP